MRFYSCYAFDLDGTLYRGQEVVPGAPEALSSLVQRGAKILYVTNNSGQTKAEYVAKLTQFGFEADENQIVTSGLAAAAYCREQGLLRVHLVGEPGLVQTFQQSGIEVVNVGPDGFVAPVEAECDAVVSGICRQAFSYALLNSAMQAAQRTGIYIACNRDLTYPVENGRFCPGSGAIVAAIEACSGIPAVLVGKPQPGMLTHALARIGIAPSDTLMVGDRLDTDIECGRAAGCETALVLSGVSQEPVEDQWCINSVMELAFQI